jgi:hypothetical protein
LDKAGFFHPLPFEVENAFGGQALIRSSARAMAPPTPVLTVVYIRLLQP